MNLVNFWERVQGRYRGYVSGAFCRRTIKMRNSTPLISFTFDDFPCSAINVGGEILKKYGVGGTYYASLGLANRNSPVGLIFSPADLAKVIADGHELGCHTFAHCPAWETDSDVFERAIVENRRALSTILPHVQFSTMSYPISDPRPSTKCRAARHFRCCRGGGQIFNAGTTDLNDLRGFFLEQSAKRPAFIKQMIDQNNQATGWLIFATHDVCDAPSRFGCTPALFEETVDYAVRSGARILPVAQALDCVSRNTD